MRPPHPDDDPELRAHAAMPEMLADLGLPPTGWRATRLMRRTDPDLARAVLRCDHRAHPSLVIKAQTRPSDAAEHAGDVAYQRRAHDVFPHAPDLSVPELVWEDPEGLACALRYVEGEKGAPRLRRLAPAARGDALRHLGRWFAALHGAGGVEAEPFHPRASIARYREMAEAVRAGAARVAQRPVFLGAVAELRRRAGALAEAGAPDSARVLPHGDAHLGNFLWGPDGRLWGYDLYPRGRSAAAQDVAKLLMDVTTVVHAPEDVEPGDPVPPATRAAFLEGYGAMEPDDPVLDLFCRAELVRILSTVPALPAQRSTGKARTLARVLPVIRRVFGHA
ncbi:aminoglycoside phosphotransferase family protein [Jannaschia sp. Os4]|uniref:aminoglycoside phosphotransferase family protein n=1 Tax=Jannaschia sp. Os4 TaxID=2807617 RepID=UPI00193A6A5D|nr:aminoglycoside phosphotransferase family protein [Jannaschia sp. Os4]MBM2575946.1 aminoglycoside phosphotransferase family protein [Jannaschia sp. Os4]